MITVTRLKMGSRSRETYARVSTCGSKTKQINPSDNVKKVSVKIHSWSRSRTCMKRSTCGSRPRENWTFSFSQIKRIQFERHSVSGLQTGKPYLRPRAREADLSFAVIPVVIFLTPLSSNSEIKRIDRPTFLLLAPYWRERSSQHLPFCSTWGFRPHWAGLRTPALSFDRCTAPVKLPASQCPRSESPEPRRPEVESKKRHKGELASPSKQRSDLRRSISLATEVSSLFYARDAPPQ